MIKNSLRLVLLSASLLSSEAIASQDSHSNVIGKVIERCWNTGSLSTQTLQASIVVSFETNADGFLVHETIAFVSGSRGTDLDYRQAFRAARRAIIRCMASDPLDLALKSRFIELRFDPEHGITSLPSRPPLIEI